MRNSKNDAGLRPIPVRVPNYHGRHGTLPSSLICQVADRVLVQLVGKGYVAKSHSNIARDRT